MADDLPHRLRDVLVTADFTYEGVAEVLGPRAHEALMRNETTPGRQRTGGGTPIETLIRLFLLQTTVPIGDVERALPGLLDRLAVEGILEQSIGEVRARLDVRPYASDTAQLWVVSDLTPGLDGAPQRILPNHVLGISPASTQLAQLTIREPFDTALDLGTGCGVQALHLATHVGHVVATDVNPRALWAARFNAALNDVESRIEVVDGSFFEPVAHQTFDLIATNPPFVISPATGERLVYRDSGLPGDRVVEDIVRAAPDRLNDDGWCQILANWIIDKNRPWDERLATWLSEDVDAFVVQREVLDPASYVELWLKDSGHHGGADYLYRYDTWLEWFDRQGIEAIGFGWINLHRVSSRSGAPTPDRSVLGAASESSLPHRARREFLDWPYDVEQPIAPAIHDWGIAIRDEVTFDSHLVVAEGVQQEAIGRPGAEDPAAVVLRQTRGLKRARQADTVEAALVGACDGELSVGQIIDAIATLLERDAPTLREVYLDAVSSLLAEGFLTAL